MWMNAPHQLLVQQLLCATTGWVHLTVFVQMDTNTKMAYVLVTIGNNVAKILLNKQQCINQIGMNAGKRKIECVYRSVHARIPQALITVVVSKDTSP